MKYNNLIVDIYNLFYKASWVGDDVSVSYKDQKFQVGGIISFLNLMDTYIKKYATEDCTIYWLFDNAKTSIKKYRKSLSEDYKKTRIPQPDWFYKSLDMLELILKSYRDNSYLFRVKFLEADDYVNHIVDLYIKDTDNVLLFSEDSDWSRALNDNIHQYMKSKIYTKKEFYDDYNFEPTYSNICFYKTLYGDKSDNIKPALNELPKQYFYDIIKSYSNVHDFILDVKNNNIHYLDFGWIERIKRDEDLIRTNWSLVESANITSTELDSFKCKCKFQINKLQIIYSALNLLGKVDSRVAPIESSNDILDTLLNGISIPRKKT